MGYQATGRPVSDLQPSSTDYSDSLGSASHLDWLIFAGKLAMAEASKLDIKD